jgi:ribosome-associated translation inhibitor RaiA
VFRKRSIGGKSAWCIDVQFPNITYSRTREDAQVNTIVSFRDIEPTRKVKAQLQAVSEHLEMYFVSVVSVEWVIRAQREQRIAQCKLHSKSGYYRATASSDDIGQVINMVVEKLTKQRRRKKKIQRKGLRLSGEIG